MKNEATYSTKEGGQQKINEIKSSFLRPMVSYGLLNIQRKLVQFRSENRNRNRNKFQSRPYLN